MGKYGEKNPVNDMKKGGGEMRIFCRELFTLLFLLLMLFVSNLVIAADKSVAINVSTQVQDALNSAAPARKKRLKEAIAAGNKILGRFLDGSIFLEDSKWPERTGSLLGITGEAFNQMAEGWNNSIQYLLVCPNIQLIEMREHDKGAVEIMYQSTRIGVLVSEGSQFNMPPPEHPYSEHYSSEMKGKLHQITLYINGNNKLTNVDPQEQIVPMSYKIVQSNLKSSKIRVPIYMGETNNLLQFRIASYDQVINEMDHAASEVCKE
jgi:hypothetical protein